MEKMKSADRNDALPEPVALTPDQIKEIAGTTAGALGTVLHPVIVIAGGLPARPSLT